MGIHIFLAFLLGRVILAVHLRVFVTGDDQIDEIICCRRHGSPNGIGAFGEESGFRNEKEMNVVIVKQHVAV